jgi:hypothetical protein
MVNNPDGKARGGSGGGSAAGATPTTPINSGVGNQGGLVNNWDGTTAVSWETWQSQLAFAREAGAPRETKARSSEDARYWYDNYVTQWNAASVEGRNALDEQHSFALVPEVAATAPSGGGGGGGGGGSAPPKDVVDPIVSDPVISPVDGDDTNEGSDMTPEDNDIIDEELDDAVVDPSQDKDENDENDTVLTVRDVTPEDAVVDPATGQRYATPEAARQAGITNWVWASDYTG